MKKITPINKEVPIDINELFFSTTDSRGVIEYGNDVFIKTSRYNQEELFGAPHNLIRHPDMPKCVFKIFWDKLKAGSPICAYVKNMSKDGCYYWVFASAFPVENQYLSIRFKPTSELLKTVQDLYVEVLLKEKQTSMAEGETFLLQRLKELGFNSYEDFMTQAAIKELNSFEALSNSKQSIVDTKEANPLLKKITDIKRATAAELNSSFSQVSKFTQISHHSVESMETLALEFRKLFMLSLNMNILASKFGKQAASLEVISNQFSKTAAQIENEIKIFSKFSASLVMAITQSSFNLSFLKIEMNMVDFFLKESLEKSVTSQNAFDEMIITQEIFTNTYSKSSENLLSTLNNLKEDLRILSTQIESVIMSVGGLEIVKQVATIESSRHDEVKAAFKTYIDEMNAFNILLKKVMSELHEELKELAQNADKVINSTLGIKDNIKLLFDLSIQSKN